MIRAFRTNGLRKCKCGRAPMLEHDRRALDRATGERNTGGWFYLACHPCGTTTPKRTSRQLAELDWGRDTPRRTGQLQIAR